MTEELRAILKAIYAKDISALTESDKIMLRARVSYLGKKELEKFASILKEKDQPIPTEDTKSPAETNPFPPESEEDDEED